MHGNSDDWPGGGGEAARAIRQFDWSGTALGPLDGWSQSLRSSVDLVLAMTVPAAVLWGGDLITVPNARFRGLAEDDATSIIGRAAASGWPAGWPDGAAAWARVGCGETTTFTPAPPAPALTFSPVRDETGRIEGALVIAPAPAADRALLAELQHQSRNALAWTRSIAKRTAETSEDLEDYLMHLDGRLDAFSRVRSAASVMPHGVSLAVIIGSELVAAAAQEDGQASVDGPEIDLEPRVAESFAIAMHELVTNAVKFGALATPEGHITVNWSIEDRSDRPALVLEWKETGVEGPVRFARRGFGLEVIERSLPYQIGATTRCIPERDGIRCVIEADLARITAA